MVVNSIPKGYKSLPSLEELDRIKVVEEIKNKFFLDLKNELRNKRVGIDPDTYERKDVWFGRSNFNLNDRANIRFSLDQYLNLEFPIAWKKRLDEIKGVVMEAINKYQWFNKGASDNPNNINFSHIIGNLIDLLII